MKIIVDQECIDRSKSSRKGFAYDPTCECPIAYALCKIFTDHTVRVSDRMIWIQDNEGKFYDWNVPSIAAEFIRKFDQWEEVDPFGFEIPDEPDFTLKNV